MKKKIKALLISQFFWPESFPINPIIKSFKEIDYTIITAKPNYPGGSIFKNYRNKSLFKELLRITNDLRMRVISIAADIILFFTHN